jgi:hypothetical protein
VQGHTGVQLLGEATGVTWHCNPVNLVPIQLLFDAIVACNNHAVVPSVMPYLTKHASAKSARGLHTACAAATAASATEASLDIVDCTGVYLYADAGTLNSVDPWEDLLAILHPPARA